MTKKGDTMFSFDMTKLWGDYDPAKMAGEFAKLASQYRLPGVDMEKMVDSQRRNLEALTAANRVVVEGMQAVARRQADILKETMEEAQKALDGLTHSESPQDAAARQAEVAKEAFEKAISNMRELAEMVSNSNSEAAEAINKRIAESLDEIRTMASSLKA